MFFNLTEVFLVFLRLGMTSFGGPIAHLGYFHAEFVERRRWLDEHSYSDLVALCQILPGPSSSQVGIAVGIHRAGYLGAVAAWLGFTLPSAVLMVAFAYGLSLPELHLGVGSLHGLKLIAVPVVAQAVITMGQRICTDLARRTIAVVAAAVTLTLHFGFAQIAVIVLGAFAGVGSLSVTTTLPHPPLKLNLSRRTAILILAIFFVLLIGLPLTATLSGSPSLARFDSFFRAGSLVFGGGHVVLPLLQAEVVDPGWVSGEAFMAGYGVAQALPGPLFAFTAYLGAISKVPPSGLSGAGIALVAAFLPSFLLVFGVMPFWEQVRLSRRTRLAIEGINAAVVGILISALFNPVWTSAVLTSTDFAAVLIGFAALAFWQVPPWLLVLTSAVVGGLAG